MKRYFFILFALLIIFGCTKSDDDKAAKLVKEWLEKNVNDPSSLEIVSITPVKTDSVLSYEDDIDYEMKKDEIVSAYQFATRAIEDNVPSLAKEYENKAKAYEKDLEQIKNKFKPYSRGKITTVKYRAKNGFGALILEEKFFRFDDEITKIVYPE